MVQTNFKIVAYGTQDYLDKYSNTLQNDCKKFNYQCVIETVPPAINISTINHTIQQRMIEYVRNMAPNDRICFMDPECRIVKQIPIEWINSKEPVAFYKIEQGETEVKRYKYGRELPFPICMQPFFASANDIQWMEWWMKISDTVSVPETNNYVAHELFVNIALDFHKVLRNRQIMVYNRAWTGKHVAVKGSYITPDTIFLHPNIHSVLDSDIKPAHQTRRNNPIMTMRTLHNHFQDYNVIKNIDELMFKEKTDIKDWPEGTKVIRINTENWYMVEDWHFNIKTGQIRHQNYPLVKYHHSMEKKLKLKIATPWTEQYNKLHNGQN